MSNFFKKIFQKLKMMLSFEEGIDISDEYQVLKRRNIVIKNIIFFSNIVYTVILFVISFLSKATSNWVITIIFVPVTFCINHLLSRFINNEQDDKMMQIIAMYMAAFYMFLTAILLYFKLKTLHVGETDFNFGEAGYILVYFALLVVSMYQNSKMLKNVCFWTVLLVTIIHFTITYNIVDSEYATDLFEFIKNFFTSNQFVDIVLRTLILILYMIVLVANVRIGEYVANERKKELVKRQDVQTDYSDVVSDLFNVILGMKSTNQNDIEHIDLLDKMAEKLGSSLRLGVDEIISLKNYTRIHIEERKSLQVLKKENMTEEDFAEVRRRSEVGAKVARRLQLEEKCEDIIRTHIEGAPTRSFKTEMNNMLMDKESQIILMCDCYITMREAKSYKRPYAHRLAIEFMNHELVDYFDDDIFEKFMKNSDEYETMYSNSI